LEKRAQQVLPGSEGFGEKKEEAELGGGEMVQNMYAYMNKLIKNKKDKAFLLVEIRIANFRVSGLILRSLIYFELILVQSDKHRLSFSFLQADNHFFQQHLLKRLSFLHCMLLAPLPKIRWAYLYGFIFGSSILFQWSSYLFLCQYHVFFIAIVL
jgi:hypothetical protein